jgi:uncharacterized protein YggU (UPF0235/DUF167 family)
MRITIQVRPSSPRASVGPSPAATPAPAGAAPGPSLLVRVNAPPVAGQATEAALRALAEALGVRRRDVSLVTGTTSRVKVVEVTGDEDTLRRAVARLAADAATG